MLDAGESYRTVADRTTAGGGVKPAAQIAPEPRSWHRMASGCGHMRTFNTNQEPSAVPGEAHRARFDRAVDALSHAIERYQRLHSPPWFVVPRHDPARALHGRAQPGDHDHAPRLEASIAPTAARLGIPIN
jgi:hypothetical protein